MKKSFLNTLTVITIGVVFICFSGCLKDTGRKTYTISRPIYHTTTQIRDAVKSDAPQSIINPGKMFVLGNYIFLNEKEKGIHIIDNTNPASPINKAFIHIPGNEDIAVKNNVLYADCYIDLLAIDITDINNIKLKSYLGNIFPERLYINGFYNSSDKFIVDWITKDTTIDIDVPEGYRLGGGVIYTTGVSLASSLSISTTIGIAGSMSKLAIVNNYLYVVSTDNLNAISIDNVTAPTYLTKKNLHLGIGAAETIYPFQDKLFIGSSAGMYIFSITAPDNPQLITTFNHASACDPVITDGTYAYITLRSGNFCNGVKNELEIVNVKNINSPTLEKIYNMQEPKGLSKDGNILFICDKNIKVYDASNTNNLKLLQTINANDAFDIICINGIAIVSDKDGLSEYDYTNTASIKLISSLKIDK